jgi:ubiquinone/menaquinone biosynthesis C-methylase UbiE
MEDMNDRTFDAKHAHRLEDPERLQWLPPAAVLAAVQLKQGMRVADIGAGTGYFALPMAREIGDSGKVLAVDFQTEMLEHLRQKLNGSASPKNIELVHGEATATTLPDKSVDLVFLANVWHELDDHAAALAEARRILRPGGHIAILDWRPDVSQPPGPPLEHRLTPDAVTSGIQQEGWTRVSKRNVGVYSYVVQASTD